MSELECFSSAKPNRTLEEEEEEEKFWKLCASLLSSSSTCWRMEMVWQNVTFFFKWAGSCLSVIYLVFLALEKERNLPPLCLDRSDLYSYPKMNRSFILSRPSRRKLKQSGILKERVFGCDLGEHLLNSGRESKLPWKFIHFHLCIKLSYWIFSIKSQWSWSAVPSSSKNTAWLTVFTDYPASHPTSKSWGECQTCCAPSNLVLFVQTTIKPVYFL